MLEGREGSGSGGDKLDKFSAYHPVYIRTFCLHSPPPLLPVHVKGLHLNVAVVV
jgi:hypothetical protein